MKLQELKLRTVRLPLIRPYVLSYRTFTEFEPIIVEVRDSDGRVGWGEGHISPGSSRETREGGWHSAASMPQPSSTKTRRRPVHCRRIQRILKPKARLFAEPLRFAAGELVLPQDTRQRSMPTC